MIFLEKSDDSRQPVVSELLSARSLNSRPARVAAMVKNMEQ
jgi:hypothetical protein